MFYLHFCAGDPRAARVGRVPGNDDSVDSSRVVWYVSASSRGHHFHQHSELERCCCLHLIMSHGRRGDGTFPSGEQLLPLLPLPSSHTDRGPRARQQGYEMAAWRNPAPVSSGLTRLAAAGGGATSHGSHQSQPGRCGGQAGCWRRNWGIGNQSIVEGCVSTASRVDGVHPHPHPRPQPGCTVHDWTLRQCSGPGSAGAGAMGSNAGGQGRRPPRDDGGKGRREAAISPDCSRDPHRLHVR